MYSLPENTVFQCNEVRIWSSVTQVLLVIATIRAESTPVQIRTLPTFTDRSVLTLIDDPAVVSEDSPTTKL